MNANHGYRHLQFIVAKDYNIGKVMELGICSLYLVYSDQIGIQLPPNESRTRYLRPFKSSVCLSKLFLQAFYYITPIITRVSLNHAAASARVILAPRSLVTRDFHRHKMSMGISLYKLGLQYFNFIINSQKQIYHSQL